jgi:hypothetical protein
MDVDTMRRIDRFHRFHDARPRRGEMLTRRVAFNWLIYIAKSFVALVNALLCPELSTPCSKTTAGIDQ